MPRKKNKVRIELEVSRELLSAAAERLGGGGTAILPEDVVRLSVAVVAGAVDLPERACGGRKNGHENAQDAPGSTIGGRNVSNNVKPRGYMSEA